MERLLEMLGILAALYLAYRLTIGRWTYFSPEEYARRKEVLKQAGLATRFYFMNPRTQVILTCLSGGTFTLYWFYKQWSVIKKGFKKIDGSALPCPAWLRAIGGFWSFFPLGGIINRTCEYMKKDTSWSPIFWGILWLGGLGAVIAAPGYIWKIAGGLIFCAVPAVFQRRINTLTKEHVSAFPRTIEILITLLGAACVLGIYLAVR